MARNEVPVEEFIYDAIVEAFAMEKFSCGSRWFFRSYFAAELILKTCSEPRLMTYESLSDGGGFATGTYVRFGVCVMDEDTSIVKNLFTFARFYRHESCGQCSPCRQLQTGWK
ncbi:MAG: NADH-ubiquinone oxidoreductase-F iron-sulfur binding region domain-containing protein [Chitinophagales bacterium]